MAARHFIEALQQIKLSGGRVISAGEVIDATDWPNREQIIKAGKARACFPPSLTPDRAEHRRARA